MKAFTRSKKSTSLTLTALAAFGLTLAQSGAFADQTNNNDGNRHHDLPLPPALGLQKGVVVKGEQKAIGLQHGGKLLPAPSAAVIKGGAVVKGAEVIKAPAIGLQK